MTLRLEWPTESLDDYARRFGIDLGPGRFVSMVRGLSERALFASEWYAQELVASPAVGVIESAQTEDQDRSQLV